MTSRATSLRKKSHVYVFLSAVAFSVCASISYATAPPALAPTLLSNTVIYSGQGIGEKIADISNDSIGFGTTTFSLSCLSPGIDDDLFFITGEELFLNHQANHLATSSYDICINANLGSSFDFARNFNLTVQSNPISSPGLSISPSTLTINHTDSSLISIQPSSQPTSLLELNLSLNNTSFGLSSHVLQFTSLTWHIPQEVTLAFSTLNPIDAYTGSIEMTVAASSSEVLYQGLSSDTIFTNNQPEPSESNSGGGGSKRYVCRDPKAENYSRYGRSDERLCKYSVATESVQEFSEETNEIIGTLIRDFIAYFLSIQQK